MYVLIIGYNNISINLIKSFLAEKQVVFLIDNKKEEDIQIQSKFFYYYEVDITDMKKVLEKASKKMLLKVFVATEDDCLNLMIEETLKDLDNVQVIYESRALKKVSCHKENNSYLQDFLEPLAKVVT